MGRNLITLLLLAIIGLLLVITNPSPEDFKDYLKEHLYNEFKKEQQSGGILGDLLAKGVAGISAELASSTMRRENYYVFSIYSVKLDTAQERKFLGIAGQFVPL